MKIQKFLLRTEGLSILELVISIALFALILSTVSSFLVQTYFSNSRVQADKESLDNARKVLDIMSYEIKGAESIYTPTSAQNQLSLQTSRYLPSGENKTFIDFFLCQDAVCEKREGQQPIALTSSAVKVTSLSFTQVLNASRPSVKISVTVERDNSSATLSSTASLRSY